MTKELKWYSFRSRTVIVLLVLTALCWYLMRGRYIHPVGTGPAGPSVDRLSFEHPWSSGQTVLLGFGDSITSGYGATPGRAYFDLLAKNDDSKYPEMRGCDLQHVYPKLHAQDDAEPYTTSEEHLRDQIPYIAKYPPTTKGIIVMTTGGNDVIHNYGQSAPTEGAMYGCKLQDAVGWSKIYRKRLKSMIAGISKKFPGGCEIFIGNVYDPTDGVCDIQNAHLLLALHPWPDGVKVLDLWNRTIAETCAEYPNVHLVDIHGAFLGHGIHCRDKGNSHYRPDDPNYWYFSNLEDPNDRGYDAVRRLFLREIVKALHK